MHSVTPAIVALQSARPDLLSFEVRGQIRKSDIEWMAERVNAAFDEIDKIDMLIVMTNFEGAELGAVFDAEAAAVSARSLGHVRRYAVVGAPAWAAGMINVFRWLTPVEERTFALNELSEAREWIGATA